MDFAVFLSAEALSDLHGGICAEAIVSGPRAAARNANRLLDQTLSLREHPERGTVLPEFHQAELRELRDGSDRIVYSVNMASRSINVVRFLQG